MRSRRVLAIDIGAAHVACGSFVCAANGRMELQEFAFERQSFDPGLDGGWRKGALESFGRMARERRLSGACSLVVPGHLVLAKFLKIPSVSNEQRSRAVASEAAGNIPFPLDEVAWDYAVVADGGDGLEVMLSAAKTEALLSLCQAGHSAGFRVERAMPGGLCLFHAFRLNYPEVRESVVVANIGARSTTLLFVDAGRFYLRTVALAGNSVTQFMAGELRIDFRAAERLKLQILSEQSDLPVTAPARLTVGRAVNELGIRLQREITRSMLGHQRQTGAAAPVALFLTGGGSLGEALQDSLAKRLELRVERFLPLRQLEVSAGALAAGAGDAEHFLAELVGLAAGAANPAQPRVNLLPPAVLQAIGRRKRRSLSLAAALAIVVALLPPILHFHRATRLALADVSRLEEQLQPLRALERQNEANGRKLAEAREQLAALRPGYETRNNWIEFLAELQERLAKLEDAWLERLHLVRPNLPIAGDYPPAGAAVLADGHARWAEPQPVPAKLVLSGRLLDVANPQSRVSPEATARVRRLLSSFVESPFIAGIENERFDNTHDGVLRFDFTLLVNPRRPL